MPKRDELEYIDIDNSVGSAKIALQGGHVFNFERKDRGSVLFLSDTSTFKKGKAIRGGIPICWPWFGVHKKDSSLPNHGFARTALWEHRSTKVLNESETKITLTLNSSTDTLALWPYVFRLTLDIYVGRVLKVKLTSQNLDTKPFILSSALHTYLAIDSIYEMKLEGLEDKRYFDKRQNAFDVQEGNIDFSKEVDRIYQNVEDDVIVKDTKMQHTIHTEGTKSIVVWNPAEALARSMADLSNHTQMLCVESANVLDDTVTLDVGESHTLTQIITTDFSISQ